MNREEIICLADEAGMTYLKHISDESWIQVERFVNLIRQAHAQPDPDEGDLGSIRLFIKRDGTWHRVDSYEEALKALYPMPSSTNTAHSSTYSADSSIHSADSAESFCKSKCNSKHEQSAPKAVYVGDGKTKRTVEFNEYVGNKRIVVKHSLVDARAENEPVAYMHTCGSDIQINTLPAYCYGDNWIRTPLYTSPQSKPLIALTDEEIADVWANSKRDVFDFIIPFARAIEAKLGSKNYD